MKASSYRTLWATIQEAAVLCGMGWRVLSYGTGPDGKGVLLCQGVA